MKLDIKTNEKECYSIWSAQDNDGFLEVGNKITLEIFDMDMDGIFKNLRSWKTFVARNFLDGKEYKYELSKSFLKRWCQPLEEYHHLFAVNVGGGKNLMIDSKELDFTYSFEFFYSRAEDFGIYPYRVEIYVTAELK